MPQAGTIEVAAEGDTVVLHVAGELDDVAGRVLVDLAESAVSGAVRGLAIDLGGVAGFTAAGAAALATCGSIGCPLPAGVQYRSHSEAGLQLLLAAAAASPHS